MSEIHQRFKGHFRTNCACPLTFPHHFSRTRRMKTQFIFPNHEFLLHPQPSDVAIFNIRKKP